jgi:hypothetical protein
MDKEAIDKSSTKDDYVEPRKPPSVDEMISNFTHDDDEIYSVKIQDTNTGELRSGPAIPRVPEIEGYCRKVNSVWPLQLYCGVRSAELDRDIKSLERVWDCVREVVLGLLNGYPMVGLAEVERILRWGDCNIFVVARPPPTVGKITGIVHNGMGERCEWFYDLVYGIPELLRATYEKFDCESSRENMERLEKAGHIVANYDKVKVEMERVHPELMKQKMEALKREKEAKSCRELRDDYRARVHTAMVKDVEEVEKVEKVKEVKEDSKHEEDKEGVEKVDEEPENHENHEEPVLPMSGIAADEEFAEKEEDLSYIECEEDEES